MNDSLLTLCLSFCFSQDLSVTVSEASVFASSSEGGVASLPAREQFLSACQSQ